MNAPVIDTKAEQSVLGAFLVENSVTFKAREIKADLFYHAAHKEIFNAMINILNQNKAVDMITLTDELEKRGTLNSIGGVTYLTSLVSIVTTTRNIDTHIQILEREVFGKRDTDTSSGAIK